MASRLDLHEMLKTFADNVYYQAPPSNQMSYPAIKYSREDIQNDFADDEVYKQSHFYEVTVVDEDPDSEIVEKVSKLPTCRFNRHYTADGLNHDVFILHY